MDVSVGVIYRQFAVAMASSIFFSGLLALSFTPALSATMLKPIPKEIQGRERRGFFGAFNRSEEHTSELQSRGEIVCRPLLDKKIEYNRTIRADSDANS